MIKAIDIDIKYGDMVESFSVYTENIEVNLPELIHQSFLPSSSLPVKLFMGVEYIAQTKLGKLEANLNTIRNELRMKVSTMTHSRIIQDKLEQAIELAIQWFGN